MAAKDFLRNYWPGITIGVTAAAIALTAIVMLINLPPRMIVMATGPEGGAYYELGKRYRAELANEGVEVRLVPTAGSQENRALLVPLPSGPTAASCCSTSPWEIGDTDGVVSVARARLTPKVASAMHTTAPPAQMANSITRRRTAPLSAEVGRGTLSHG